MMPNDSWSHEDWPKEHTELRDIDSLLRCPICYEFITTAMMTQCSHNYCSLCIRQYIAYQTKCPVCFKTISAPELKNNRILDDLVKHFKCVKPMLLKILPNKKRSVTQSQDCSDIENKTSHNGDRFISNQTSFQPNSKCLLETNNKFPSNSIQEQENGLLVSSKLSTEVSKQAQSVKCDVLKKSMHTHTAEWLDARENRKPTGYINSCSSENISEHAHHKSSSLADSPRRPILPELPSTDSPRKPILPELASSTDSPRKPILPELASPHKTLSQLTASTHSPRRPQLHSGVERPAQPSPQKTLTSFFSPTRSTTAVKPIPLTEGALTSEFVAAPSVPRNTVACPVCSVNVPERSINQHLDACLKRSKQLPSELKSVKRAPIPKLVYNLLKDSQLRQRCRDAGISAAGDRQAMIKRHQIYTLLYNSECDSLNPKPVSEILKEVDDREKLHIKSTAQRSHIQSKLLGKKATEDEVAASNKQYFKQHKKQFATLIAEARKKRNKKRECEIEKNECREDELKSTKLIDLTETTEDNLTTASGQDPNTNNFETKSTHPSPPPKISRLDVKPTIPPSPPTETLPQRPFRTSIDHLFPEMIESTSEDSRSILAPSTPDEIGTDHCRAESDSEYLPNALDLELKTKKARRTRKKKQQSTEFDFEFTDDFSPRKTRSSKRRKQAQTECM